jgi:aminoglycoside 3-N-acetyltransferase
VRLANQRLTPVLQAKTPPTVAELLDALAIPRDAILFVHSSFRGLAQRGWRPEAMLEGLLDYLSSGTLLLPTMSWRAVTSDNPRFSELATPSITGVLSEIFRTRFATHRSLHPTHSVAGSGMMAGRLLGSHHIDDTPCSDLSPFGLTAVHDGYVMLLGVEMDSCTLVHHAEEKIAPGLYLRPEVETYTCRRRDGSEIAVRTRRHFRLARNFWQFENQLARHDKVRHATIDDVPCRSFPARAMDDLIQGVLRCDPRGTLAKPGQRFKMM